jgi:hypothetical protein
LSVNYGRKEFLTSTLQTDLVPKDCLEAYCGSATGLDCPLQPEFKEFNASASKGEHESRLDNLVSSLVSKAFAEFRLDPTLPTIRPRANDPLTCKAKASDFFLLEELKNKFSEPISRRNFYPGSLLRWLHVHSDG